MLKFMLRRLKEPSTWAGIVTLLTVFGITLDPAQTQAIATAGAAIVAVLMVFLKESGEQDALMVERMDASIQKMTEKAKLSPVNPELELGKIINSATASVLQKAATPPPKRSGLVGKLPR